MFNYIEGVLKNMPEDWLKLTTHRLDIYNEKKAKIAFLDAFEVLYKDNNYTNSALKTLPTAYDYIRLGHPLSSILEWVLGYNYKLPSENVISFDSEIMPILAILRKNKLDNKETRILFPSVVNPKLEDTILKKVYGYSYSLHSLKDTEIIESFEGSTILVTDSAEVKIKGSSVDFYIVNYKAAGAVLLASSPASKEYISEIQHVRRRETVAMTPSNALSVLHNVIAEKSLPVVDLNRGAHAESVQELLKNITGTKTKPLMASSGLSMQYGILMGLIAEAENKHPNKEIKIIVPPNCYGGTNDQSRRIAAAIDRVEVLDMPVDGGRNMVESIEMVLQEVATQDAVPLIIAEIPTNPRVEVPNLEALKKVLAKERFNKNGKKAVDPVFILDQTFCPNVHFLGEGQILSSIRAIAYASGSKFPSGGLCTAGYCVANDNAAYLMDSISYNLELCENEATDVQLEILATQLPSMNTRIKEAYLATREFVTYIQETLPEVKINFVSEALAAENFTPSVFSMDLPTKGESPIARELYKRELNLRLINKMITEIPEESKYCVSYGQLKGCYWTIPATSTQGTTKEDDKDYIIRASLSGTINLEKHKEVFKSFAEEIKAVVS